MLQHQRLAITVLCSELFINGAIFTFEHAPRGVLPSLPDGSGPFQAGSGAAIRAKQQLRKQQSPMIQMPATEWM